MLGLEIGDKVKLKDYSRYEIRDHKDEVATIIQSGAVLRCKWEDGSTSCLSVDGDYCFGAYKYIEEVTMDNLTKGTILLDSDKDEVAVLSVMEDLIAISRYGGVEDHKYFGEFKTVHQLKQDGYTVKEPKEDVKEVTLEEVAAKMGIEVSKLRIKDK